MVVYRKGAVAIADMLREMHFSKEAEDAARGVEVKNRRIEFLERPAFVTDRFLDLNVDCCMRDDLQAR